MTWPTCVCLCTYVYTHRFIPTHIYHMCTPSFLKISRFYIVNQMSAFSSNGQITEVHKVYKMDHCHSTEEI